MDLSNLNYSKSSGKIKEENIPEERHNEEPRLKENHNRISASDDYKKTGGKLSTSLVFILSGGEKKEKDFFKELINKEIKSLRVLFMSKDGQGLQPYQMDAEWQEIKKSKTLKINSQEYRLETLDKVFLISDVDQFYDQLEHISNGEDGLKDWIISNPCFEIWLYYCFLNEPERDLKVLQGISTIKRSLRFKALQNELVKGGLSPIMAFEHMKEGIENSKSHYTEDENKIPVLFSTQMHILSEYLLETMERNNLEYSRMMERKKKKREMYRKI